MQKLLLYIVFLAAFAINASAQNDNVNNFNKVKLSPLLSSTFKKPLKVNPLLAEKIKHSKFELMYWPNYPLTAAQIEARDRDWKRRNKQTIDEQIASDIIKNQINALMYGRKTIPAVVPKF